MHALSQKTRALGALLLVGVSVSAATLGACGDDSVSPADAGSDTGASTTRADGSAAGDSSLVATDASTTDGASANDASSTDANMTTDTGTDAGFDATDTGPPPLNDCTTFVDHTADAEVDLAWDFNITMVPSHCSIIKVGSVVKWTANPSFVTHPLIASGGDMPNPITSTNAVGNDATITFPNAGTYGYACMNHPFLKGVIQVVP